MLALLVPYALAAPCPPEPSLRDPDGEVTVLAQNLKFIITGAKRKERDQLLADYLGAEGAGVDLLLLSEARLTSSFDAWTPEWCFYTQAPVKDHDGYRWAALDATGRPPAGLAMGVRQRREGVERKVSGEAGRRYRARPTSFAEGVLGRLFGFRKGWAGLQIDDTHLVWSHTQASYRKRPERGAGNGRSGRVGQFADLADDLGRPERATLITGDLNLLAGFRPHRKEDEARVTRARDIDNDTVARFRERTGIDLAWPWARAHSASDAEDTALLAAIGTGSGSREEVPLGATADQLAPAAAGLGSLEDVEVVDAPPSLDPLPAEAPRPPGTFAGGFDRRRTDDTWDVGAAYDRVGVNEAFLARHPGTRVRRVEIAEGWMRVSDHLGLEIAIPFAQPRAEAETARRVTSPKCRYARTAASTGRILRGTPSFGRATAMFSTLSRGR